MKRRPIPGRLPTTDLRVIGVGVAALYWVLESLLEILVYGGNFVAHLLPTDPNEIWMRSMITGFFVACGFAAQIVFDRRRGYEEELRRSEERYQTVSRATNDVIWDVDLRTGELKWTGAVETMFGYSTDEVKAGTWWEDRLHPEDGERVISGIEGAMDGDDDVWSEEYRFRCGDGSYATVIDRAFVIRGEGGEAVRIIGSMMDVSERKQAEEEIRHLNESLERKVAERTEELEQTNENLRTEMIERERAEEKHRSIFENAVEGIFQTSVEGRLLTANPAMARMLGYESPEELLSSVSNVGEQLYMDPERRTKFREIMRRRGSVSGFEAELYRKDKSTVWVSFSAANVCDESGELVGFEGIVDDVTERKRTEEERERLMVREREARQRVTDILESITDAFYTVDRQWRITYINPQGARLARRSREELVGHSLWEIFPDTVGAESYHQYHRAMREDVPVVFERYYAPYDLWTASRAYPSSEGLSIFVQDITERKRAQEALRQSEEQYRAVVEQTAEGLFLFDAETKRIVETNSAFRRLLGYSTEQELSGMVVYDLIADDQKSVDQYVQKTLQQGHYLVGERRYRRQDGSVVDVEVSGSVISFDGSQVVCALAHDVTERKRTERALREVREAERNRIARDLHDTALQDLTYASAEAQIAQMLSDNSELDARLQRTIEAVQKAGQELREVVYQLRLGDEQSQPFPQLLESLVEQRRKMAPETGIILFVEEGFPQTPLGEMGTQLLRVVQEALTNVRRHSGARSVRVALGVEGDELVAEVADDGRGFAAEGAHGVGMKSMRERTVALGGKLEVESEPGRGTRVRFRASISDLLRRAYQTGADA